MERWLILILGSSLFVLGCQRDKAMGDFSTITIHAPKARDVASKTGAVGAFSALPADRKICYGVNVLGAGISQSGNACNPPAGVRGGFVEPGGEISVMVPKGSGRVVELFAFVQDLGQNNPCPGFGASLPAAHLIRTYKIGAANNVEVTGDVTVVEITAAFPGLANHIAQQMALPPVCTAGTKTNLPGFDMTVREVATGGSFKLIGEVGRPVQAQTASGGGMKWVMQ